MIPSSLNNSLPHLAEAARLQPDNPEFQSLLAEAFLREGSSSEALLPLQRALRSQPAPRIFFLAAYALLLEDRLSEALRFAHEAVAKSPVFDRALYLRGRILWAQGDSRSAIADFQQAALYGKSSWYVQAAQLDPAMEFDSWPDIRSLELDLLRRDYPQSSSDQQGGVGGFGRDFESKQQWWSAWSARVSTPAPNRSAKVGYAQELSTARRSLRDGRTLAAHQQLQALWKRLNAQLDDSQDDTNKSLIQGTAEALAVVSCQLEAAQPDAVSDIDLYVAGARYPVFLRRFVDRLLIRDERSDFFALEVYVTAMEHDCLNDPLMRKALLTKLAETLRIHLSCSLRAMEPRIPLLERMHRLREGLVFPRLYLGYSRFRTNEFGAARLLWQDLAGPIAQVPRILFLRAQCAEKLGLMREAIALYEASLEQKRVQPHAHFGLGRLLLYGGGE